MFSIKTNQKMETTPDHEHNKQMDPSVSSFQMPFKPSLMPLFQSSSTTIL